MDMAQNRFCFSFCQCIKAGIGVPVRADLETVVFGYGIGTKFKMPSNISRVWSEIEDPFEPIAKRSIDKQEHNAFENRHIENDVDNEEETNNFASMRWTLYKAFAEIAERCSTY